MLDVVSRAPKGENEAFVQSSAVLVTQQENNMATKPGLYANIAKKRERIAAGSGERMRKPGAKGAPTAEAFRESAKTAKVKK